MHNEWWYVVGHLHAGTRTFGYEVTAFRLANIRPPGFTNTVTLYRTDIAITDEANHRFFHRVTYYFPQSVSVSSQSLDVRLGTVTLRGSSRQDMTLRASLPAGAIDLHLASQRPPMDVGGRGYITMGDGFSYYYSLTDVASSGSLTVKGHHYSVSGTSWLDHQWGNWSWQSIRGWTWMALQLGNGVQFSVFDFRSTAGRVRAASVLPHNGKVRTLPHVTITATGSWRSPHTKAVYPSGWIVTIPALHAVLHVTPSVRDQEMTGPGMIQATYWEGSGRVSGTYAGKPVTGLSYTELTGFAGIA